MAKPKLEDASNRGSVYYYFDFPVFPPSPLTGTRQENVFSRRSRHHRKYFSCGTMSSSPDTKRIVRASSTSVKSGCWAHPSSHHQENASAKFGTSSHTDEGTSAHRRSVTIPLSCKDDVDASEGYTRVRTSRSHLDDAIPSNVFQSEYIYGSPPPCKCASRDSFVYGSPPYNNGHHLREQIYGKEDQETGFDSTISSIVGGLRKEIGKEGFIEHNISGYQTKGSNREENANLSTHLKNMVLEESSSTLSPPTKECSQQSDNTNIFVKHGQGSSRTPIFAWERRPQKYFLRHKRSETLESFMQPNEQGKSLDLRDGDEADSSNNPYLSELYDVSSAFCSLDSGGLNEMLENYSDRTLSRKRLPMQHSDFKRGSSSSIHNGGTPNHFNNHDSDFKRGEVAKSLLDRSYRAGKQNLVSESLFHQTVRTARDFLRVLSISILEASNNDYERFFHFAGLPDVLFAQRNHAKYGVQAIINKLIFQEFDEVYYSGMERNSDQSALLNDFQKMSFADAVDAIDPSNKRYDKWFRRFCVCKLQSLEKSMPWLVNCYQSIFHSFVEAMKPVWQAHLLAHASLGLINMYIVREWTRFHEVVMEVVENNHDEVNFLPEIQLMVNPGFYLQHSTIKAQVYLLPKVRTN